MSEAEEKREAIAHPEMRKVASQLKTALASCLSVSALSASASLIRFSQYPLAEVLDRLLEDKTTGQRVVATRDDDLSDSSRLTIYRLKEAPFLPRVEKSRKEQAARTKKRGEVFTPSWLCRKMNDFIWKEIEGDNLTQRRKGAKDAEIWKGIVDSRVLEITCGEAPFIVSRYDASTGEIIPVGERIGILDRKLRVVSENAADENEWMKWALRAYESVYGYEYQGDSLIIARANLILTFAENLEARWRRKATKSELVKIANRITWNFWQMDGLKGTVVPQKKEPEQDELGFDLNVANVEVLGNGDVLGITTEYTEDTEWRRIGNGATCPQAAVDDADRNGRAGNPLPAVIFDWRTRKKVIYNEIGRNAKMKFDFAIGNPPYQEEASGTCTSDRPIYNTFMDESYRVADKVELITPARFLFNAGATPKAWNMKMLSDSHFKVLEYTQKSDLIFANTDIKGGVAITYHDITREYGAIETFTSYAELNSIMKKVGALGECSLSEIISNRGMYRFSNKAYKEQSKELKKTSDPRISTNAFREMPILFMETKPQDGSDYIELLGNLNGERVYRWFRRDYLKDVDNLLKYKVVLPKANGSGAIGEVLSTPIIGTPMTGFTETFISVGNFERKSEAEACLKYVKTKFARTMLGILKITQDNTKPVWKKVPLQDFTSKSDIDWSKSVKEIDRQLYRKYKLSEDEIKFIEEKVRAME